MNLDSIKNIYLKDYKGSGFMLIINILYIKAMSFIRICVRFERFIVNRFYEDTFWFKMNVILSNYNLISKFYLYFNPWKTRYPPKTLLYPISFNLLNNYNTDKTKQWPQRHISHKTKFMSLKPQNTKERHSLPTGKLSKINSSNKHDP